MIKRKIRRRKGMSRKRRMVGVLMSEIMVCVICVIVAAGIVRTSVSAEGKILYKHNNSKKINQNNDDLKNDSSTDAGTKWNLILVNSSHKLDQSYAENISLTQLRNEQSIDSRCYPELQQMMDDCRAQGYSPIICSSYRTHENNRNFLTSKFRYI